MTDSQKNKVLSGVITALIMAVVVVICVSFGYNPPNPPIPEEGVEVNLGDSDFGSGDNPEPSQNDAASQYVPPAANERVSTQDIEPTTPINASPNPGTVTNPNAEVQPKEQPKEPEINRNALFLASGLGPGPHTLKIVNTGDRNPESSGNRLMFNRLDIYDRPSSQER